MKKRAVDTPTRTISEFPEYAAAENHLRLMEQRLEAVVNEIQELEKVQGTPVDVDQLARDLVEGIVDLEDGGPIATLASVDVAELKRLRTERNGLTRAVATQRKKLESVRDRCARQLAQERTEERVELLQAYAERVWETYKAREALDKFRLRLAVDSLGSPVHAEPVYPSCGINLTGVPDLLNQLVEKFGIRDPRKET